MEKKLPERLATEIAAFAVPRPLRLMFQDEARFGRISDVRHCWDKKPHRPMVRAMMTQEYTYAYGAVSPVDGRFDSLILPQVNGQCMPLFLDEIAARYPHENVVMVMDGAGWHKNQEIDTPKMCARYFCRPMRLNSTRRNIYGTSCVKNSFTTAHSTRWTHLKHTLKVL